MLGLYGCGNNGVNSIAKVKVACNKLTLYIDKSDGSHVMIALEKKVH